MKALVVGFTLFLCNASVSGQKTYHAYSTGVESYNKKTNSWINDKSLPVDFTIKIEKQRLTMGDAKKSTYVLQSMLPYDSGPKDKTTMVWKALDVKDKEWYITITTYHTDPIKMRISFSHKISDTNRTYYDVLPE